MLIGGVVASVLVIGLMVHLSHASSEWNQETRDYILEIHNDRRREEGGCHLNKLEYDKELENQAKSWAERCVFKHEMKDDRGENLAWNSGKEPEKALIKDAADSWFNEKKMYRYGQHSCGSACHYTQMVWGTTTKVGCYTTRCAYLQNAYKDAWYLVCFYTPQGNWNGEKPYEMSCDTKCLPGQTEENGLCSGVGIEDCKNKNKDCPQWADMGDCEKNIKYMKLNCRLSCKFCTGMSLTNQSTQSPEKSESSESCKDNNTDCAGWAKKGECKNNQIWMEANCQKSCNVCTSSKSSQSPEKSESSESCKDNNTDCAGWAKKGECKNNQIWMEANCQKSCNVCTSSKSSQSPEKSESSESCKDNNTDCAGWAKKGECKNNQIWMEANCQKSCNVCTSSKSSQSPEKSESSESCKDNNTDCAGWAKKGECKNNQIWMEANCQKSCNVCTSSKSSQSPEKSESSESCKDNNTDCAGWAKKGECKNNQIWMEANCQKSCNVCTSSKSSQSPEKSESSESCKDNNTDCAGWAKKGECKNNQIWMEANCQKSCNVCTSSKSSQSPEKSESSESCKDNNTDCAGRVKKGECKKNKIWMEANCQKSCNVCTSSKSSQSPEKSESSESCKDNNTDCAGRVKKGECKKNQIWMEANCQKSCNVCTSSKSSQSPEKSESSESCKDSNANCALWAEGNHCRINPSWMNKNCKKSCNKCNS